MGLAYVAPIGVQNLFVIHSALAHPRRRALATAGIVIFFDVTLALACFFGVGVVMETFPVVRMAVLRSEERRVGKACDSRWSRRR